MTCALQNTGTQVHTHFTDLQIVERLVVSSGSLVGKHIMKYCIIWLVQGGGRRRCTAHTSRGLTDREWLQTCSVRELLYRKQILGINRFPYKQFL